jgi:DNA replication protein DnaC
MEKEKVLQMRSCNLIVKEQKYNTINDANIDMDFQPLAYSIVNGMVKLNIICCRNKVRVSLKVQHFNSCYIDGRAGVGKSHLIKCIKNELDNKHLRHVSLAPTNKAANNINGMTIHKFVGKGSKKLANLKKCVSKIDVLILDEVSMLQELYYRILLAMKKAKESLRFIIVGDFEQLEPVKDRVVNCDYKNSGALFELVDGNKH